MTAPGVNTQSTRVMAYLLDITTRRLQQLADEGIVKPVKRGVWDLVETTHGYIRYLRDGLKGPEDTHDARRERARLLKAQADKVEIETAILRGSVVPSEVIKNTWGDMLAAFRARMLVLPSRAATQVLACTRFEEVEDMLRNIVHEALTELAEYDPKQYRHHESCLSHLDADHSDGSAAAETDCQPARGHQPIPQRGIKRRAGKMEH